MACIVIFSLLIWTFNFSQELIYHIVNPSYKPPLRAELAIKSSFRFALFYVLKYFAPLFGCFATRHRGLRPTR